MRITKDIASEVATKLLEKKYKDIESIYSKLSQGVTEVYKSLIPEKVLNAFEDRDFRQYFNTRSSVQLKGNGWNFESVNLTSALPSRSSYVIESETKKATELRKIYNDWQNKRSEYFKLRNEIEIALYNLKTYAKVSVAFPEAIPFLPKVGSTALVVDLSGLRAKLK